MSLDVVTRDNLPIPLFLHHDDIEYGIRNQAHGIAFLNGIGVWHKGFEQTFPSEATETYEAIVLSEKEAKLLCCQPCTPAFRIQRVSKNSNGDIFEYSIIIAPGNRNKYEITLYQKNIAFQNAYRRIV